MGLKGWTRGSNGCFYFGVNHTGDVYRVTPERPNQ
jgi:hypothetical protein